ncbi:ATP-binding protein [Micromonospora sp. M12]
MLLERLVTNLVENGIKYNRPGGSLTVVVNQMPALSVVNTGQPVPAEAVAGLFEPFRRLARDRTSQGGAPAWDWPSPARSPRRTTASSRPGPPSTVACGSTSSYPPLPDAFTHLGVREPLDPACGVPERRNDVTHRWPGPGRCRGSRPLACRPRGPHPVLRSPVIDELAGARVLLKAENLQDGGSYKMRARCGRSAGSPRPATPV